MPLKKITLFSVLLTLFSAPSVLAEDTFLGQYLSINAGGTYVSNIYQGAASKTGFQGAAANIFWAIRLIRISPQRSALLIIVLDRAAAAWRLFV